MYAINGFIDDPGPGNIDVGHRMFFLSPFLSAISIGAVPSSPGRVDIMSINVVEHYFSPPYPTRDGVISWPPAGFFPYTLLPAGSKRWHYWPYGSKMDFKNAGVTVTGPEGLITDVKVVYAGANQFGNYIVFEVPNIKISTQNQTYSVVINGITGMTKSEVTYQVIIINI